MVTVFMLLELLHPACGAGIVLSMVRLVQRMSLFLLGCRFAISMVSVSDLVLILVMEIMSVLPVNTVR